MTERANFSPVSDHYLDFSRVKTPWLTTFSAFFGSPSGKRLREKINQGFQEGKVFYPPSPFRLFTELSPSEIKVVIVGQDPYHEKGQAAGLAFHTEPGIPIPPSLRNIYKELNRDLGITPPITGQLDGWVRQGVFLLNAILTVEDGKAGAHAKFGWEALTDRVLSQISEDPSPKVFMLWGNFAQKKKPLLDASRHLILEANHPSPLSALRPPVPFIGCSHFSKANAWLSHQNISPIDWGRTCAENNSFTLLW